MLKVQPKQNLYIYGFCKNKNGRAADQQESLFTDPKLHSAPLTWCYLIIWYHQKHNKIPLSIQWNTYFWQHKRQEDPGACLAHASHRPEWFTVFKLMAFIVEDTRVLWSGVGHIINFIGLLSGRIVLLRRVRWIVYLPLLQILLITVGVGFVTEADMQLPIYWYYSDESPEKLAFIAFWPRSADRYN